MALFEPIYTTRARRAHSLTGVVPLGLFFTLHVLSNASILRGDYRAVIAGFEGLPARPVIELVFVVIPLLFHAGYGVVLSRREPAKGPIHVALRWTGALTLAFVLAHVWMTSAQKWLYGASPVAFQTMLESHLAWTRWGIPWIAIAYMVGVGSASFHFAVGAWTFGQAWNLATTARARRRLAWATGAVGGTLFLTGALVTIELATGTRIIDRLETLPDGPPRPKCPP